MALTEMYDRRAAIACMAVAFAAVVILRMQGRVWWCPAGDMMPWSWDIWTIHNSQHLADPYSFTHLLHGVGEYFLIGLIFRKMPVAWRLFLAVLIEGSWEVLENTNYVINRYREETISLNYFGDSILNSMSDIVFCASGFVLAHRLKFVWSLVLFVATEVTLIFWIHDSLVINIIMLLHPSEAIRNWQMPH